MLTTAPYGFLARPRETVSEPVAVQRNCRTLLQDYFWDVRGEFWPRDALEHPGLWHGTGTFVPFPDVADRRTAWPALPHETVLLAERIRDRQGRVVDRSPGTFETVEDYRLHLHTALYLDAFDAELLSPDIPRVGVKPGGPAILHATAVAGCTCVWNLEHFTTYYRLVAAKSLGGAP